MKIDEDNSFGRLSDGRIKTDLPIGGATYPKYYMRILSSYFNLEGVCYDFSPYL